MRRTGFPDTSGIRFVYASQFYLGLKCRFRSLFLILNDLNSLHNLEMLTTPLLIDIFGKCIMLRELQEKPYILSTKINVENAHPVLIGYTDSSC